MARNKYTEVEEKIMRDVSRNLKSLLAKKGIYQADLCKKTGLARSTISDYVNGRTLISQGNLEKIAEALDVQKSDIDSSLKKFNSNSGTVNVPVLDKLTIKKQNIIGSEKIHIDNLEKTEYFFFKVQDEAMVNEGILPGDLVLVKESYTYEDGNLVLAVQNNGNIIRKIFKSGDSYILQAANPSYAPIVLDKEVVQIIGVVKQNLRKY